MILQVLLPCILTELAVSNFNLVKLLDICKICYSSISSFSFTASSVTHLTNHISVSNILSTLPIMVHGYYNISVELADKACTNHMYRGL
jgi:hypothetical protein